MLSFKALYVHKCLSNAMLFGNIVEILKFNNSAHLLADFEQTASRAELITHLRALPDAKFQHA